MLHLSHKRNRYGNNSRNNPSNSNSRPAPCSSSSSKAKNKIVKERTWFNLVVNEIVHHPLYLGTGALLHNERVVATWSHG